MGKSGNRSLLGITGKSPPFPAHLPSCLYAIGLRICKLEGQISEDGVGSPPRRLSRAMWSTASQDCFHQEEKKGNCRGLSSEGNGGPNVCQIIPVGKSTASQQLQSRTLLGETPVWFTPLITIPY